MTTSIPLSERPSFAAYFGLKDTRRNNFKLDPERDWRLCVDLDGSIAKALNLLYRDDAPKAVFEGDFGTGKTHALRYIAGRAAELTPPAWEVIHLELSGFEARTTFISGIHRPLMGKVIDLLLSDREALRKMLEPPLQPLVDKALRDLAGGQGESSTAARAWLSASRTLTPSKALKAGYPTLLDETMGPATLAELYTQLSQRWRDVHGRRWLLFIDEGESFSRVIQEDAQASIGAGMRRLLDPANQSLGLFLGLHTPRARRGTHPMLRNDVLSRVYDAYMRLPSLQDVAIRARFVEQLWARLALDPATGAFGLDRDAQRFVIEELDAIRRRIVPDAKLSSPTPRDLLTTLDLIARSAWTEQTRLPLTEETVRRWVGLSQRSSTG